MKTLDRVIQSVIFWTAYFLMWCEMKGHYVDVYLFEKQENHYMAADAECRMYDCIRRMQVMRLNYERNI